MVKNYIPIVKFNPFRRYFMYVDHKDFLADSVFIMAELTVRFIGDFRKENEKYVIVYCSVAKKDVDKFVDCMCLLGNKMLLMGYTDYEDFCRFIGGGVLQGKESFENAYEDCDQTQTLF